MKVNLRLDQIYNISEVNLTVAFNEYYAVSYISLWACFTEYIFDLQLLIFLYYVEFEDSGPPSLAQQGS